MPRLEATFEDSSTGGTGGTGLPPTLYVGELRRVVVTLRNTGTLPLRSLQLVLSHPDACCPSTSDNMALPIAEALQGGWVHVAQT